MKELAVDVNRLTLIQHLTELRKRLFIIAVAVLISTCICYVYIQPIIQDVIEPAGNKLNFVYVSPPELFLAYIKLSLVAGIVVSSPITFFQIWAFVRPGLEKKEKRYILASLFGGTIFFLVGVVFAFKVVLPIVLEFFVKLSIEEIQPMISFGNYISFISTTLLSFGLIFEMPMLVLILSRFGLITAEFLKTNKKYLIVASFIIAALMTPPDIVSQLLLAGPMIILFEISILIAKITEKKRNQE